MTASSSFPVPGGLRRQSGWTGWARGRPVILLDELHKFPRWRQFLKGFFDARADETRIVVTGSSRLDVYRRGGDSLMGRYFFYRMHPFSARRWPPRRSLIRRGWFVRPSR